MASLPAELAQLGRMMPGGMADPARAAEALRHLIHLVAPGHPPLGDHRWHHAHDEDYAALRPVLASFLAGIFGCPRQQAWHEAAAWVAQTGAVLHDLERREPVLRVIRGGKVNPTRA
jgi:hypothetical protein